MKVKAGINASIDLLISSSELFLEEFSTAVVAEPERGAVVKSGSVLRFYCINHVGSDEQSDSRSCSS